MVSRRAVVFGGAGFIFGSSAQQVRAGEPIMSYSEAAQSIWAPLNAAGGVKELVRAATLAPNNHNVQPWTFQFDQRYISIKPDLARRCPVVDPDDHHLFVSLGCATENIVQAAGSVGLRATPQFNATTDSLAITLEPVTANVSSLANSITQRQSSRSLYDGKPVLPEHLTLLANAGQGEGVEVILLTDRPKINAIKDYVVQGDTAQISDKAFVKELKSWLRFNESEALATRDGLFTGTTGNPQLPSWIAPTVFGLFFSASGENDKYAKQIDSSAGIAVFASDSNDKAHWVDVGRAVQRFALTATSLGLKLAFVNQPVEVATIRPQLASYLGIGTRRPDIVMRFGSGGLEMPRSLRKPLEQVIV